MSHAVLTYRSPTVCSSVTVATSWVRRPWLLLSVWDLCMYHSLDACSLVHAGAVWSGLAWLYGTFDCAFLYRAARACVRAPYVFVQGCKGGFGLVNTTYGPPGSPGPASLPVKVNATNSTFQVRARVCVCALYMLAKQGMHMPCIAVKRAHCSCARVTRKSVCFHMLLQDASQPGCTRTIAPPPAKTPSWVSQIHIALASTARHACPGACSYTSPLICICVYACVTIRLVCLHASVCVSVSACADMCTPATDPRFAAPDRPSH